MSVDFHNVQAAVHQCREYIHQAGIDGAQRVRMSPQQSAAIYSAGGDERTRHAHTAARHAGCCLIGSAGAGCGILALYTPNIALSVKCHNLVHQFCEPSYRAPDDNGQNFRPGFNPRLKASSGQCRLR